MLEPLTHDADPTPDKEAAYAKDADWVNLSVNTVRCDALRGPIRYGLWIKQNIKRDVDEKSDTYIGFDEMPEVREVLDRQGARLLSLVCMRHQNCELNRQQGNGTGY